MNVTTTRRRMIGITAAAAGLGLLPFGARAGSGGHLVTWLGQSMGAVSSLQIHHHHRPTAERLIERALAEVTRLERIFSLYRADSTLALLNRQGILIAPPAELVSLLNHCSGVWKTTEGAFDPTVQPLWSLYRDHFSRPDAPPEGPTDSAIEEALGKVGFQYVTYDGDRVVFARRGMALTLNGIAQGYITDRVVDILRSGGIDHSLVDMGEPRLLGSRTDGNAWQIGLTDPADPPRIAETIEVTNMAVATSGGYGFQFDPAGLFHHLIDPRTGRPGKRYQSVTVVMPTATEADALSTAFSFMPMQDITRSGGVIGFDHVRLTTVSGQRQIILR